MRQHVITVVMDSAIGKDIKEDIESKIYRNIPEKFSPWKCLLQLDLSATTRQMETYGATILPYEISKTMVKVDVLTATKFLRKKYKLWDHVENGEEVLLAATVDGGQLAWEIAQISAEIKICDEKSIDPQTGKPLFGESGCENVQ